ncbi:MAG: precorrin-6A synthase (deacetylating) [Enhydrobacter sp.]|nr:MAG: precorrin-6A synthase (deacetylating) [Enhydrobacter sp.]
MRKLSVIGIGVGDPDHLTLQAVEALRRTDVFFVPGKGEEKAELREMRLDICRQFAIPGGHRIVDVEIPQRRRQPADYLAAVDDWHAEIASRYERAFLAELGEGERGSLLVWGDPSLYDSTLRLLERIAARGTALEVEVIPGLSSVQLLAARHGIALNRIGGPVLLAPARKLADGILPVGVDDVVVVLDGELTFRRFDGEAFDIYWGACLGSPDEILIAGRLVDVRQRIEAAREQVRHRKGWIMDVYLLRRR